MLEIVFLFLLGRNIASIARKKNRNPAGYVLLLVFGWFGLGFGLGVVAAVIAVTGGMNEDDAVGPFIVGYLVGAACAAGLAYLVVGSVSKLPRATEYDDYDDADYDDRPRRRRDEDPYDYEDDRPRGRRDEDRYEHDDDRPRRRRHEDDEDDDYDRPRRRRDDY